MDSVLRPQDIRTAAQFVAALRFIKERSGLTYRQLEQRARSDGMFLARSTLSTALNRNNVPREEVVSAFLRSCGCTLDEEKQWLDARERLSSAGSSEGDRGGAGGAGAKAEIGASASHLPVGRTSRRRFSWTVVAALIGVLVLSSIPMWDDLHNNRFLFSNRGRTSVSLSTWTEIASEAQSKTIIFHGTVANPRDHLRIHVIAKSSDRDASPGGRSQYGGKWIVSPPAEISSDGRWEIFWTIRHPPTDGRWIAVIGNTQNSDNDTQNQDGISGGKAFDFTYYLKKNGVKAGGVVDWSTAKSETEPPTRR